MDREEEIRLIAFSIWQSDGCCDGHDLDNWLKAEEKWESKQKQKITASVGSKAPPNIAKTGKENKAQKKAHSHRN